MFWTITLIVVAAFLGIVGWLCRPRGSAKGKPTADLDSNIRRLRYKSQGRVRN